MLLGDGEHASPRRGRRGATPAPPAARRCDQHEHGERSPSHQPIAMKRRPPWIVSAAVRSNRSAGAPLAPSGTRRHRGGATRAGRASRAPAERGDPRSWKASLSSHPPLFVALCYAAKLECRAALIRVTPIGSYLVTQPYAVKLKRRAASRAGNASELSIILDEPPTDGATICSFQPRTASSAGDWERGRRQIEGCPGRRSE